jgi:hypothetical protein
MARDTLLVVDANLPKTLAGALRKRAREAVSAAELGLAFNVKDPELLRRLAELYKDRCPWVLVTGDDAMPAEHGPVIIDTHATVATIFPDYPMGVTEHVWNTDVVQRWAHAMQEQTPRTVRRYGLAGSQPWRPPRRRLIPRPGTLAVPREVGASSALGGTTALRRECRLYPGGRLPIAPGRVVSCACLV